MRSHCHERAGPAVSRVHARQLVHQYPLVPLWQNQAYGLALFSYNGELTWGVNGEWDLLPDIEDFVGCIESAFDELSALGST
ncbi:MAG: DUF1298 domain-containing protein [Acidimicrobiia bacterium]|nr:DUF1298 domain-containing protein [Acidimicrobiia bacterium]